MEQVLLPDVAHDTLTRLLRPDQPVIHSLVETCVYFSPTHVLCQKHPLLIQDICLIEGLGLVLIGPFRRLLELLIINSHLEGSRRNGGVHRSLLQPKLVMLIVDEAIKLLYIPARSIFPV